MKSVFSMVAVFLLASLTPSHGEEWSWADEDWLHDEDLPVLIRIYEDDRLHITRYYQDVADPKQYLDYSSDRPEAEIANRSEGLLYEATISAALVCVERSGKEELGDPPKLQDVSGDFGSVYFIFSCP